MSAPLDPREPKRAYRARVAGEGGPIHHHGGFKDRAPRRSPIDEGAVCSSRDLLSPLRRAVELHLRGDYEGAEQRLRAVLERAPELPQAHHHLAVVLHSQGKTVQSVRHLRHALALDPHLPGAEERLERYLEQVGKIEPRG